MTTFSAGQRIRCINRRLGCFDRTGVIEQIDSEWVGRGGVLATVLLDTVQGQDNGLVDLTPDEMEVI